MNQMLHALPTVFANYLVTESVNSTDDKNKSYSILTARIKFREQIY